MNLTQIKIQSICIVICVVIFCQPSLSQEYIYHPFTPNLLAPNYVLNIDLDHDGDQDIISSSEGDNHICWHECIGNQNFLLHIISSTIGEATGIDVSDLDKDGDLDFITNSYEYDFVYVLENTGNEIFKQHQLPKDLSFERPKISKAVDYDMDGDLDIVTAAQYDLILYENTAPLTFVLRVIHAPGVATSLNIQDIDEDGDPDFVTLGLNGIVTVFDNTGAGTFTRYSLDQNGWNRAAVLADIDLDGDLDIITGATFSDRVNIFINNGSFSFTKIVLAEFPNCTITSIDVADIDLDSDLDIVYSCSHLGFGWLENQGFPDFSQHDIDKGLENPINMRIANMNNDAYPDIIYAAHDINQVGFYLGDSSARYKRYALGNYVAAPDKPGLVDLDLDNDLDIYNGNHYFENHGNRYFSYRKIGTLSSGHVSDLDQDGDRDIIAVSSSTIVMHKNDGFQDFEPIGIISPVELISSLTTFDVNQDGFKDIFTVSGSRGVHTYIHDGSLNFTEHKINAAALKSPALTVRDIDQDGDTDAVVAEDVSVSWYENIAADTLLRHSIPLPSQLRGCNFVNTADLDQDGDIDIYLNAAYLGEQSSGWLENNGSNQFQTVHFIRKDSPWDFKAVLVDKERDGDIDILESYQISGKVYWNINAGNGMFTEEFFTSTSPTFYSSLTAGDLDNDFDVDIVMKYGWYECIENTSQITYGVFYDLNENGTLEISEPLFSTASVAISPREFYYYIQGKLTTYYINLPGIYTVSLDTIALSLWYLTTNNASETIVINSPFSRDTVYFGLAPRENIVSSIDFIYSPAFLCNRTISMLVHHLNNGTLVQNGILWVAIDSIMNLVMYENPPDTTLSSTLHGWRISNLLPGYAMEQLVQVTIPGIDEVPPGELLTIKSYAQLQLQNEQITTDTFCYQNKVLCASDPNDKQAHPSRENLAIYSDECLIYTIRFQNVGNYLATDVIIRDTLDPTLDMTSCQIIASSHPAHLYFEINGNLIFAHFKYINLPDSSSDSELSHGFLAFRVCLNPNTPVGTQIYNSASIYFDSNPPIITNRTHQVLQLREGPANIVNQVTQGRAIIYPNPSNDRFYIQIEESHSYEYSVEIMTPNGEHVMTKTLNSPLPAELDVALLQPGVYIVRITDGISIWGNKIVKL